MQREYNRAVPPGLISGRVCSEDPTALAPSFRPPVQFRHGRL